MSGGASDISCATEGYAGEGNTVANYTSTGSETNCEGHWTADAEFYKNISSAKYTDVTNQTVEAVIEGITMCIPVNDDNRHYQAILEWVDAGNTISEP